MQRMFSTLGLTVLLLGTATTVPAQDDPNDPEALATDATGLTTFRWAPLQEALQSAGVQLTTLGGARLTPRLPDPSPPLLTIPVTGGAYALRQGAEFVHSGGLALTSESTRVLLTNLILSITSSPEPGTLSALLIVNGEFRGRIALCRITDIREFIFTVAPNRYRVGKAWSVDGVVLQLAEEAAQALNRAFNTSAFRPDTPVGEARIVLTVEGNEPLRRQPAAPDPARQPRWRIRRAP